MHVIWSLIENKIYKFFDIFFIENDKTRAEIGEREGEKEKILIHENSFLRERI